MTEESRKAYSVQMQEIAKGYSVSPKVVLITLASMKLTFVLEVDNQLTSEEAETLESERVGIVRRLINPS